MLVVAFIQVFVLVVRVFIRVLVSVIHLSCFFCSTLTECVMCVYSRFKFRDFEEILGHSSIFGIDDALIGAGLGFGGGVINNLFAGSRQEDQQAFNAQMMGVNALWNSSEADKARMFNAEQSTVNRNWLESMSNSAYQRQVQDMRAAGLNPILAAQKGGGASTPGAGAASGPAASTGAASSGISQTFDVVGPAISTAMAFMKSSEELRLIKANANKAEEEAKTPAVQRGLMGEQAGLAVAGARKSTTERELLESQKEKIRIEAERDALKADAERKQQATELQSWLNRLGVGAQSVGQIMKPVTDFSSRFRGGGF